MKRPTTKAKVTTIVDESGLKVKAWEKVCICCGKSYVTSSRTQKYCSSDCQKKSFAKKTLQKKEYDKTKGLQRLISRAHSVGVETMYQLELIGVIGHQCVNCHAMEGLEVHHKDFCPLNNTPSNLEYRCHKCHALIHSQVENDLKEQNKTLDDFYQDSYKPIIQALKS